MKLGDNGEAFFVQESEEQKVGWLESIRAGIDTFAVSDPSGLWEAKLHSEVKQVNKKGVWK